MLQVYLKRHNRFLAIVLILTGLFLNACIGTKYETVNIHLVLKEKPRLVRIRDLIAQGSKYNKDFNSSACAKCARYFFDQQSEIPEDWQNQYRLTLTIESQVPYDIGFHVALCNDKNQSVPHRYLLTEVTAQYIIAQIYFDIDKLKQLGYISSDSEKQQDLCIYIYRPYMGNFSKHTKYVSNDIVLTADEINELVREYEALQ